MISRKRILALIFGAGLLGMAYFQLRQREDLLALMWRGFRGGDRDAARGA